MPVSTRQATPGPSTRASTALQPSNHSKNTRKRTNSETQEDAREVKKKIKIAQEPPPKATSAKDKKKKRNRRKKKTSVVKSDAETEAPTGSTRRSAPLSSNGQTVTMTVGSAPTDQTTNNVKVDEDKEEPVLSPSDKGKGKAKAKSRSPSQRTTKSPPSQPIASGSGSATAIPSTDSTSQELEIARLKEQLAVQTKLLERHESHIGHHHQSLTCQICLELMYKPYALAPCGHITCYGCLIRWFTAPVNPLAVDVPQNPPQVPDTIETILNSAPARNGAFIRRRKKCPVCRAIVVERPVEMWGIKDMVAALVRSQLVDIPVAPEAPAAEEVANADPWRNVFRRAGHTFGHPAFFPDPAPAPRDQDAADREEMGWFDAEDGGVHRCIDCYHEIWGGVCSNCHREYPGHGAHNDDEDDLSDGEDFLPFRHDPFFPDDEGSDEDGDDDGAGDWGYNYQLYDLYDGSENDYEEGDEELHFPLPDLPLPARRRWGNRVARLVDIETDEDDEDDEDEESIYGGSFIDDAVRGGDGGDGVDEDEDDDDDDDEVEFVEPPRVRARAPVERRRRPRRYEVVEDDDDDDEDDDDDDDDEDDEGSRIQRRSTRVRPVVISDDESDDESDDSDYRRGRPPRHAQHRQNVDVSDSDDDDDDDDSEEEVEMDPPASRFHQRIYPVIDWDEDDEDDEDYDDGWN